MSLAPLLIVTVGPTGSGKSRLPEKVFAELGRKAEYVNILIDDLIETNPAYKSEVKQIIGTVQQMCNSPDSKDLTDCEQKIYTNPPKKLLDDFSDAYFNIRRNNQHCKDDYKELTITCDELNDNRFENALNSNNNIVFEITGENFPVWLNGFIEKSAESKYEVIFAYSVVEFDELIIRNINRTIASIKDFKHDESAPAPRLPDIREDIFLEKVKKIKDVLTCIKSKHDNDIKSEVTKLVSRLMIFDNNKTMKLIYDSGNKHYSNFDAAIAGFGNKIPSEEHTLDETCNIPSIKGGKTLKLHNKSRCGKQNKLLIKRLRASQKRRKSRKPRNL